MNTKLREEAKNDFEKDFFRLMSNSVFVKTMENVRNYGDVKLVATDKRRKRLVSEPNYHTHKKFSEHLLAIEMKKAKVTMTKPIYLGLSLLGITKTPMYEFWYDYIKSKYGDRAKLCYMDTDSFAIYIETEYFYKDIAGDVERWFDTSDYDENDKRPLPIGKNQRIPGVFKDELGGKIVTLFVGVRAKIYAYLKDDDSEHKKPKGTKKCIINVDLWLKTIKIVCLIIKSC